jgi:hypothetical protein
VSRRTTGAVEVDHPLRFVKGGEPLGAPLTLTVGGLVANFDSHLDWVALVDELILVGKNQGSGVPCASSATVTVLTDDDSILADLGVSVVL